MVSAAVANWKRTGRYVQWDDHRVFVADVDGSGVPLVAVHGYPGSSFDFAGVLPALGTRAVAPDLLGYGLSDKPEDARYSLFEQADLIEAVVAEAGFERCTLLGHDMGTTVVSELVARADVGTLGFEIDQVFLTNGSIFIDMARLTRGQRLGLRWAGRTLPFPLPPAFVRHNLRSSIAPGTNVRPEALADLTELIRLEDGDRLLTRQLAYLHERTRHQAYWTAALVDFPGRLTAIWGVLDPIAGPQMPQHLATIRPDTDVVWLEGVGHWPTLEAPERVAAEIGKRR